MKKLSVVLATRNEEDNIGRCLAAVKEMLADLPAEAGEIIIFDEYSTDRTREVARNYGAKVFREPHHDNFHITKQKAIDKASGDWILQLDADEVVTVELAKEIKEVMEMSNSEILARKSENTKFARLIERHNRALEKSETLGGSGDVVAFLIPRKNMFLGKPLIHAGVYPDPAIRLIKKGKAHLPAKSVHENMEVNGQVAWLFNDLLHYDSPNLRRYFNRLNRYTSLQAKDMEMAEIPVNDTNLFYYAFPKPLFIFLKLYLYHKGFLDGMRGFLWSTLSALHYPIAYFKYWEKHNV